MTGQRYLPPFQGPTAAVETERDEIQVHELWKIIRRNLGLIAVCLFIAVGGALLYAFRATPIYQAQTSIRIEDNQSTLPVLDVLKEISTGNGNEISTEMEVLRSRTLAEVVIDSLALRIELLEPMRVSRTHIFSALSVPRTAPSGRFLLMRGADGRFALRDDERGTNIATVSVGQPFRIGDAVLCLAAGAEMERVIRFRLRPFAAVVHDMPDVLTVSRPSRDANVVVADYVSPDPELARDVLNVLAYSFITRRQVVKKTESHSTAQFLRQQLDTLTRQLAQAEDSVREFREQAHVVSLDDEATADVQRLAQLEADRASLEEERSALSTLLDDVAAAASKAKPSDPSPYRRLLGFPSLLRNQSVSALFQALTTVENERADLLVRRTPADPDVMVLTSRVHELEDQVRSLATTYLQGLQAQVASIDAELAEFSKQLERVPAREVEYARLKRRPKVLEDIYTMLQSRLKEAQIAEAVADPSVRVIDSAVIPDRPIKPNKPLVLAIGALLGLLLGTAVVVLREGMDRGVHTSEDVQRLTGGSVLALIPRIHTVAGSRRIASAGVFRRLSSALRTSAAPTPFAVQHVGTSGTAQLLGSALVTGIDPRSPVSEAYRALRTNITFARAEDAPRMLVFTSPMPGDGKSTTAANFTVTLAQTGTRVLLVDGDMRRGMLHAVFGISRDRGLSDLMLGAASLRDLVRPVTIGSAVTFDFLSTGTLPPNPSELLGSRRMRELLARMHEEYDMVVIDSPPVNIVTDAAVLGTIADGVVVVARAGVTSDADLTYAMSQIHGVHAPVLGVVLNDVDFRRDARYQGGYGYYQYHYYGSDESLSPAT